LWLRRRGVRSPTGRPRHPTVSLSATSTEVAPASCGVRSRTTRIPPRPSSDVACRLDRRPASTKTDLRQALMAEREGFEPSQRGIPARQFRVLSQQSRWCRRVSFCVVYPRSAFPRQRLVSSGHILLCLCGLQNGLQFCRLAALDGGPEKTHFERHTGRPRSLRGGGQRLEGAGRR
jgi:hypothetical protein